MNKKEADLKRYVENEDVYLLDEVPQSSLRISKLTHWGLCILFLALYMGVSLALVWYNQESLLH